MKVTLIFPPSIYQTKQTMPPLGISWLAAILRQNGFPEVNLIDAVINKYSNEDILEILNNQQPDLVGLSFGTQNRFQAFELARLIKEKLPKIHLTVGGPHPTLTADDILRHLPFVDSVVRGEGEYTLLELARTLEGSLNFESVKGLSFKNQNGKIVHNLSREPISDLDILPWPARDLLPLEKYQQKIPLSDKVCTSILSSRGCPYNCVYCSTSEQWGHKIRHRSPKNVVGEIEHLLKTYELDGIGFFDDVLTMDKSRVIAICKEILDRNLQVSWWCEARANTIDEEMVDWMKRAGCEHISMAIESGSDRILKNIKKAITVEQGVKAIKTIKAAGIKLKIFFMHSLPGETYQDIKKTVFLSRYVKHELGVEETTQGITIIYPGTNLEKLAKQSGILPENFSWSLPFEETRSYPPLDTCRNMPIFEQPDLSYEQVFKYVRRAKIEYYLRHPGQFLATAWKYRRTLKEWLTTKVK